MPVVNMALIVELSRPRTSGFRVRVLNHSSISRGVEMMPPKGQGLTISVMVVR